MDDNLIMLSSVTLAMKSREILKRNGMFSKVVRTPISLKTNSCGYSLSVPKNINKALQILMGNGIPVLGTNAVDKL